MTVMVVVVLLASIQLCSRRRLCNIIGRCNTGSEECACVHGIMSPCNQRSNSITVFIPALWCNISWRALHALDHYIWVWHQPVNTKGGSITVLLTSCLIGLESAVWQLRIFVFMSKTDLSKPVKQEVNSTVILPPLVFPASAKGQKLECFEGTTNNCFITMKIQ